MKFKYFLRGLGTGIIFTSIICLVAFQNVGSNNISDKEVIERAKKLGLVEKEESAKDMFASDTSTEGKKNTNLDRNDTDSQKNDVSDSDKENDKTSKENDNNKKTTELKNTEVDTTTEVTTEKKTTEEKKTEEKTTEEKTTEGKTTEKITTEQSTTEAKNQTVTITIKGGSTSFPVCQKLQELGVIKDATDFDNYLIKHGYANRIRVGTHTLKIGMSYEEIAIAISDPM